MTPFPSADLVAQAEHFARAAHQGQTRKGAAQEPYACHLEEVAGFVARHGGDSVAVAAAWLHDTVEDCGVTSAQIAGLFGEDVAAIVAELTDDKSLPKPKRKALQVANAPKKSARAALCKLGDKWSNIGAIAASPPVHWDAARQDAYVAWALRVTGDMPDFWPGALAEVRDRASSVQSVIASRSALQ